ncbi:MAG: hypothetical protein GXY83_15170 [Rhodopirellula sp.]|nr:hypothetical protein [Rhodopirellula sp.]
MSERQEMVSRLSHPHAALALGLAVALLLVCLPRDWSAAGKNAMQTALWPGQVAARAIRQPAAATLSAARRHFRTTAQLADAQRELESLREEKRRLLISLAAMEHEVQAATIREPVDHQRLLGVECVEAHVLGQQALAFLGRNHLLDVGFQEAISPNDLVIPAIPELIDRGSDWPLAAGQYVVRENGIWGKIVEVGRHASTVRGLTEPGYRDLVRLSDGDAAGPQGILEGTGEPLARIRLIEVTEPVTVGDAVYAAVGKGILARPLRYGRVVRVERPIGAAHWDIWMQPTVDVDRLEQVAVLKTVLNPRRLAVQGESPGRR